MRSFCATRFINSINILTFCIYCQMTSRHPVYPVLFSVFPPKMTKKIHKPNLIMYKGMYYSVHTTPNMEVEHSYKAYVLLQRRTTSHLCLPCCYCSVTAFYCYKDEPFSMDSTLNLSDITTNFRTAAFFRVTLSFSIMSPSKTKYMRFSAPPARRAPNEITINGVTYEGVTVAHKYVMTTE